MMILLFILSLWSASVQAQEFSVAGFRLLPNDVSAFITPVRDLNDEPCALVKVEAPPTLPSPPRSESYREKIKWAKSGSIFLKALNCSPSSIRNGACSAITGSANRWKAE